MIPIFKPYIGSDTENAAVDALDLGWLGMGSYVKQFEEQLSVYLEINNGRKLVAVNTCTSALHLALLIADVGPGDEVILADINWVALAYANYLFGNDTCLCGCVARYLVHRPGKS